MEVIQYFPFFHFTVLFKCLLRCAGIDTMKAFRSAKRPHFGSLAITLPELSILVFPRVGKTRSGVGAPFLWNQLPVFITEADGVQHLVEDFPFFVRHFCYFIIFWGLFVVFYLILFVFYVLSCLLK